MAVSSLLIPRSEWGAAAPRKSIAYTAKDLFICHHSGNKGNWPTPAEEKAAMWFWQHYHFQAWDAADIMYNAVIFPSGRAYEGRYGGWLANGGGAFGCNQRGFGVALAGDFNIEMPTVEALNTLIHLALEARSAIQVPAERYWGHRDCWVYDSRNKGNDCPGNMFYAWLPTLRAVVADGRAIDIERKGKEEDMPQLTLISRGGEYGDQGYVMGVGPAKSGQTLYAYGDEGVHDFEAHLYIHPFNGQDSNKKIMLGGYANKDNVHGVQEPIPALSTIILHSPCYLVGGVY